MIDPVAAREVFEVNKKIILSAKVVRMNIWNDIQRYERGLQILERKKEDGNRDDGDLHTTRRDESKILQFTPRV